MELGPLIQPDWMPLAFAVAGVAALLATAFLVGRWTGNRQSPVSAGSPSRHDDSTPEPLHPGARRNTTVLGVTAAALAAAAVGTRVLRALLQGGPFWVAADAALDAAFWLLMAGAAVFTVGAFGWRPSSSGLSNRRGLVLGALIGVVVVLATGVPNWLLFTTVEDPSRLQFLSLLWSPALAYASLVGAFLLATSMLGWVASRR